MLGVLVFDPLRLARSNHVTPICFPLPNTPTCTRSKAEPIHTPCVARWARGDACKQHGSRPFRHGAPTHISTQSPARPYRELHTMNCIVKTVHAVETTTKPSCDAITRAMPPHAQSTSALSRKPLRTRAPSSPDDTKTHLRQHRVPLQRLMHLQESKPFN